MRRSLLPAILGGLILLSTFAIAADDPVAAPADAESAYGRVLEERAGRVLNALKLDDPAKTARVREAVVAQYRGLRRIQDTRDAKLKVLRGQDRPDQAALEAKVKAERVRAEGEAAALHGQFVARLAADLTPEQVDLVKDVMTFHKLRVTYDAYLEMLPDLTPEQKQAVHAMLVEARDRATYAGSAEEKSAVFDKFKGRINNYLAAQGYDLKLASKQWAERRKRAK